MTSPVLSADGTKLVYVSTRASGATLHILKWKLDALTGAPATQGSITSPAIPDQTATDWSLCTAGNSFVVNIDFANAPQATMSAPFYDYANDVVYVGDNSGKLHKFTSVSSGTPSEESGNWPFEVAAGYVLNGPVPDANSGNVFVTGNSSSTDSQVCYVTPTPSKTCLGTVVAGYIYDSVMIDIGESSSTVFAFSTYQGATVHQYHASLGSVATVNINADPSPTASPYEPKRVFPGAFDHGFFTTGSGYMYVCGKSYNSDNRPALHRIAISSGTMLGPSSHVEMSNGQAYCSPVTEFYNATTGKDWIFFSVGDGSARLTAAPGTFTNWCGASATNGACLMALDLSTSWASAPVIAMTAGYVAPDAAATPSSTSGIIVANNSPQLHASSIYFSFGVDSTAAASCNATTGVGCAVKLTESGLR